MNDEKSSFIEVHEIYFGKVGHGIKNPLLRSFINIIFSDKVRKKEFNYGFFSLTFKDTEIVWYTNFMNRFGGKVKCFFTQENNMFIVYPVMGDEKKTTPFVIPAQTHEYVEARERELGKSNNFKLDSSTIKKGQSGDVYILEYKGKCRGKENYTMFEHTIFEGRDKIVFQAFISGDNDDPSLMSDLHTIANSIRITAKK